MDIIWVGIGGALGSLARWKLGGWLNQKKSSPFALGTLTVNIIGAFLLGLISGISDNNSIYHLIGDGFLGAFTTFSALMFESTQFLDRSKLMLNKQKISHINTFKNPNTLQISKRKGAYTCINKITNIIIYISITVILGLLAYSFGNYLIKIN